MDGWLLNLTRVAAVGSGLMAGLFFVFSVAIMPALDRLAHLGGTKAMQAINDDIQNPLFLLVFLGSGVTGAALAVSSIWTWDQPGAGYRLTGGVLALLGIVVLTVVYHVPRNNALDAVTRQHRCRRRVGPIPPRVGAVEPRTNRHQHSITGHPAARAERLTRSPSSYLISSVTANASACGPSRPGHMRIAQAVTASPPCPSHSHRVARDGEQPAQHGTSTEPRDRTTISTGIHPAPNGMSLRFTGASRT